MEMEVVGISVGRRYVPFLDAFVIEVEHAELVRGKLRKPQPPLVVQHRASRARVGCRRRVNGGPEGLSVDPSDALVAEIHDVEIVVLIGCSSICGMLLNDGERNALVSVSG